MKAQKPGDCVSVMSRVGVFDWILVVVGSSAATADLFSTALCPDTAVSTGSTRELQATMDKN